MGKLIIGSEFVKIKILSLIIILTMAFSMFTGCSFDKNYGNQLPPGLPSSIPIIEGTIEDSRSTTFEDGKGFVIGIRTPVSYEDTIKFYKEAFETKGDSAKFTQAINMVGTSEKVMTVEVRQGINAIAMEIVSGEGSSYVNIAVHLGK